MVQSFIGMPSISPRHVKIFRQNKQILIADYVLDSRCVRKV